MPAWNPKANDIFLSALEIPSPDQRRAFLHKACRDESGLRDEVYALLAANDSAGSFLSSPPSVVVLAGQQATESFRSITEGPGTVIGPYKLLEQIGEGGFGVVFMAEQQQPVRRKVALKVV